MRAFDQIVEEKIRAAIEAGEFDHLPGAGKPLQLEVNPYEPEGWGAAFRLLKKNGYTLPWLEERQEIEQAVAQLRRWLEQAADDPATRAAFADQVETLNRRILSYNLRVPRPVFQRNLLVVDQEWSAAQQASHLNE
jgi:DnaJ family protein C protein 28